MLSELKGSNKVAGIKQTRKALREGTATKVFLADDAEQRVLRSILELCSDSGVETVVVPTMHELGLACGIEVGAACAAIVG